jgi:hypothetical protein
MNTDASRMPNHFAGFCWQHARRRPLVFEVAFAKEKVLIDTLEGIVRADAGDAVVTGVRGERWPVSKTRFAELYEPVSTTRMREDGRYRRRAGVVRTTRLEQPLSLFLTDEQGVLTGNVGDWLVQHTDGRFGIVADDIFERTYELIT